MTLEQRIPDRSSLSHRRRRRSATFAIVLVTVVITGWFVRESTLQDSVLDRDAPSRILGLASRLSRFRFLDENALDVLRWFKTGFGRRRPSPPKESNYSSTYFGQGYVPSYPVISDDFDCYRSLQGSYDTMGNLTFDRPDLARVVDIGPSWLKSRNPTDGHELQALVLTNNNFTDDAVEKAPVFIMCSIHARELTPAESCARFAESLVNRYDDDADVAWILDYTEIHMVLQANPDSREFDEKCIVANNNGEGCWRRKNMNSACFCGDQNGGVDLNRNFPHSKWGTTSTTSLLSPFRKCFETFPGCEAASEPETRAVVNYVTDVMVDHRSNVADEDTGAYLPNSTGMFLDIHSYGQDFFWPDTHDQYSGGQSNPNDADFFQLADKMSTGRTDSVYSTTNLVTGASGSSIDWAYDGFGLAAVAFEIGTAFYQRCEFYETVAFPRVFGSLTYAVRVAAAPYALPHGPEVTNLTVVANDDGVLKATFVADEKTSRTRLYVDVHPYRPDAVPDATTNTTGVSSATIDRPSSNGESTRHVLYAQAESANGKGPVYAVFFDS